MNEGIKGCDGKKDTRMLSMAEDGLSAAGWTPRFTIKQASLRYENSHVSTMQISAPSSNLASCYLSPFFFSSPPPLFFSL